MGDIRTLIRLLTPSSCDASNFIRCDILSGGGTSPANCDLGSDASASRTLPKNNEDDYKKLQHDILTQSACITQYNILQIQYQGFTSINTTTKANGHSSFKNCQKFDCRTFHKISFSISFVSDPNIFQDTAILFPYTYITQTYEITH